MYLQTTRTCPDDSGFYGFGKYEISETIVALSVFWWPRNGNEIVVVSVETTTNSGTNLWDFSNYLCYKAKKKWKDRFHNLINELGCKLSDSNEIDINTK